MRDFGRGNVGIIGTMSVLIGPEDRQRLRGHVNWTEDDGADKIVFFGADWEVRTEVPDVWEQPRQISSDRVVGGGS